MSDYVKREDVVAMLRHRLDEIPGRCSVDDWSDAFRDVPDALRALPGVDVDAKLAKRDRLWREYAMALRNESMSAYSPFADDLSDRRGDAVLNAARAALIAHGAQVDG